jgi:hypothetical protein
LQLRRTKHKNIKKLGKLKKRNTFTSHNGLKSQKQRNETLKLALGVLPPK